MSPDASYLKGLSQEVSRQCGLPPDTAADSNLKDALTSHIRHLLADDFNGLVFILYRIDISEQRLRRLLSEHPEEDAAVLICSLILERLSQKMASRQRYDTRGGDENDEERW